jgi:hypothetical protein
MQRESCAGKGYTRGTTHIGATMPTKAELELDNEEKAALIEKLQAALDNKGEEVADLKAELEDALAKEPAPAPAPAAPVESWQHIGALHAVDGIVMFGDSHFFDQQWLTDASARSAYAIDFKGPEAAYLSSRQKHLSVEVLADGTHRIVSPDRTQARSLQSSAKKWMAANDGTTEVSVRPIKASALGGKDVTRENGAGIMKVGGKAAFAAFAKMGVVVSVQTDEAGNVKAIKLS